MFKADFVCVCVCCVGRDRPLPPRGREKPRLLCTHAHTHARAAPRHSTACYHKDRPVQSAFLFFCLGVCSPPLRGAKETNHVRLPQVKDLPEQRRLLHLQDQVVQLTLHG